MTQQDIGTEQIAVIFEQEKILTPSIMQKARESKNRTEKVLKIRMLGAVQRY